MPSPRNHSLSPHPRVIVEPEAAASQETGRQRGAHKWGVHDLCALEPGCMMPSHGMPAPYIPASLGPQELPSWVLLCSHMPSSFCIAWACLEHVPTAGRYGMTDFEPPVPCLSFTLAFIAFQGKKSSLRGTETSMLRVLFCFTFGHTWQLH